MNVSVTKTSTGEYDVKIGDKSFTLPADSESWEVPHEYIAAGTNEKQLVFEMPNYGATLDVQGAEGPDRILQNEKDDRKSNVAIARQFFAAFGEASGYGSRGGRSRVNRKTRRSKGKGRNPKRGKFRNLTSRRR